jgi:UDP-2-acetamido-2,6-beta-L-arabino-hexul-4-ose reductase
MNAMKPPKKGKAMKVSCDQLRLVSDSRGLVFEPLNEENFSDQRNAHMVLSMPGVVRGNHYHIRGMETIAVLGPALVRFRENDQTKDVEIPLGQAYCFVFPPGVPHAIQNLSNGPNMLMAFNTMKHDPQNPDSERAVLIEG